MPRVAVISWSRVDADKPDLGSGLDREVGEGLSNVALADADGAVALGLGPLVHFQHRTDEHVPRAQPAP
jgi:hypothetical protein